MVKYVINCNTTYMYACIQSKFCSQVDCTNIELHPCALVRTRTDIKMWINGLVRSYKD